MMKRISALAAAIACALLADPSAQMPYSIAKDEGFTPTPTCKTVAVGDVNDAAIWDCGRVPNRSDWAEIDHATTIAKDFTAWTLYVSPSGRLANTGVGVTITVSDTPPADFAQFDTGFIVDGGALTLHGTPKTAWTTSAAEIPAGAPGVTVKECAGWMVGDRVLLADTREVGAYPVPYAPGFPEVRTIASLSGCAVTFDRPTGHAYSTGRDHAGVVERTVPVGNLTRDVTIRSENPNGRRGHLMFTGMATIDVQYVDVADMGRTTIGDLNTTTNVKGRYAFHDHHLMRPGLFVGNVVLAARKWGMTVHASNDSTFRDNIVYDAQGWGFGTEDGSESGNVFDHNLAVLIAGGFSAGTPLDGTGFWMQGPRNILIGNVSVNAQQAGFALRGVAEQPLNTNRDNESIANGDGVTIWGLGSSTIPSVLERFREWHNAVTGFYDYGSRNLVFMDLFSRSDPSTMGRRPEGRRRYNWFGDYDPGLQTTFIRPDIQNKDVGIILPYGTATPTAGPGERVVDIVDGYFYNASDILVRMNGLSAGAQPVRTELLRPMHGNANGLHYEKQYTGAGNLTLTNKLRVTDYQRVSGDSFEDYGGSQDPTFIMPPSGPGVVGCPDPDTNHSNAFCRAMYGVSIYGEIMPANAVARARIAGRVLALGPIPTPVPVPTPIPQPTPVPSPVPAPLPTPTPVPSTTQTFTQCTMVVGGTVVTVTCPVPAPAPVPAPVPTPAPSPAPSTDPSLADLSALPICTAYGATATDRRNVRWTLGPNLTLLANGIPTGHGFGYIASNGSVYAISTSGRLYLMNDPGQGGLSVLPGTPGCRLPPSASGSTVLQANGYLVDNQGGILVASCAYLIRATFCPDFDGSTIEAGIVLRNGTRLPGPGVRSIPEPNNAPWNLCWSRGQLYVHTLDGAYGRWQGLANPTTLVPAAMNGCPA